MFNNDAGDITKGLELSDLELHAIKYILEEFATEPKKSLVCIGVIVAPLLCVHCVFLVPRSVPLPKGSSSPPELL